MSVFFRHLPNMGSGSCYARTFWALGLLRLHFSVAFQMEQRATALVIALVRVHNLEREYCGRSPETTAGAVLAHESYGRAMLYGQ